MKYNQWPRVKIAELCELIVDCVNKTAPSVDYETPYKMIRTPNIKGGRINLTGCRYVEKETFKKWTRRATVDKGDVLLTREAPMGEVGYVDFTDTVFLGQRIMQYRANPQKLDSAFLLYSFLSPDLQYQFRRHDSTGSIVSHIRVPDCSEFEISLPSLDEQRKIASTLRNIDEKIALNSHINTELEAMAKTLYDYWFVQFDFPDANGKPYKTSGGKMEYNTTLKREIPAGWRASNILSLANLLGGGTPTKTKPEYWNGSIPFFTPTDSDKNIYSLNTQDSITDLGLKNSSTRLFEKNTIFITARGSVGRLALNAVPMAMNQSCYALKAKQGVSFAFLYFLTKELIHHLEVKATGSVFNSIISNDIEYTYLALPEDNDLIDKYAKKTELAFAKIELLTKENQHLIALRDWLLPLLMNGQVTVK
ncbi:MULTISPECIES: restriction endonuclease subunit S [Enterobacteriaceae]|uniref:restriction endonuclease subunit S n=1 Tax=Enterobacteriaceae TaxID=543 RepID=UPI000931077E|nr:MULTISPECIES: restriction endonuclease subunit S [Enterobacteriaceae]NHJ95749.1 restriction endonuclease subunit S [Klebsiella quasipneumoniae subsp. similipneumoniae]OZJ73145.1 restriction endonuclease subunit S [Klebsiella pneumoniae]OZJ90013.1 restriction endonuclease subunit S [Klebsiella pneumoniae]OZJ95409.1 restriction endonuclease subunit S [Klebsiella pneumoniae]OZK06094.1 restriction endonuclease subunit S [Klebsiella pneumoniae]